MRRRALIHLGLPKCGSSALQTRLGVNVDRLAEHGAFYPLHRPGGDKGQEINVGHMALATDLAKAGRDGTSPLLADYLDRFDRSGAQLLLLSSESFASRLPAVSAAAAAPLAGLDLDLVLFTRRADAHAVSAWKHMVRRERHTGSFAEFVAASERTDSRRPAMNIARTMAAAKRLFPAATFHLHDLDAGRGDSIARVAELTGLPLAGWAHQPRADLHSRNARLLRAGRAVNQSHSDEKTLFLLACNRSALSDQAVARIERQLIAVPDAPPDPRRLLTAAESRRLLAAARTHNRAVETDFGVPLAEHAPMDLPDEARTALTRAEADAIVDALAPQLPPVLVARLRALPL